MPALAIAIGNPSRRDDGVAHAVVAQISPNRHIHVRHVLQLTPELAAEITGYDPVVFVDADLSADRPTIEPVAESDSSPSLTHASSPEQIVALARALFGFAGTALVCRLPVEDFSPGEGLSARATESVAFAVCGLSRWIMALLRNTRKTECGANLFLDPLGVRAAPFALSTNPAQNACRG
jgi:hydrogenase maturation protease